MDDFLFALAEDARGDPPRRAVRGCGAADWQPEPEMLAWDALTASSLCSGIAEAAEAWVDLRLKSSAARQSLRHIAALPLANRRMIDSAAAQTDHARPPAPAELEAIRRTATENAISVVRTAIRAAGLPSPARSSTIDRHDRDVLAAAEQGAAVSPVCA
jgi:alkylation response protein AidB-like acyl-CoA dehydrogenase